MKMTGKKAGRFVTAFFAAITLFLKRLK